MNIQEKIDDSKKRTQLMNSVTIDWQYAQQIIPSVLPIINRETILDDQLKSECKILYDLFSSMELSIKELKELIPFYGNIINLNNEIK